MLVSPSTSHYHQMQVACEHPTCLDHHEEDDDMDTDAGSVFSGPASLGFAPSVATSATSHDWDMRSASPAPSMYSMTSSLRAASYRHEFGRGINNYSEVYRLPADDEEFERLGMGPCAVVCHNNTDAINRQPARHVHGGDGEVPPLHGGSARGRTGSIEDLRRPGLWKWQLVRAPRPSRDVVCLIVRFPGYSTSRRISHTVARSQ